MSDAPRHAPASGFSALANAHLRNPAERAVFMVVAGAAHHWWTSVTAARAAHVGELDADRVLRRFAAAGIVDRSVGRTGSRYRYGAEMAYLDDDDADRDLRDPVCGMSVPIGTIHTVVDDGLTVRFCSLPCLARWQRRQRVRRRLR